MLGNVWLSFFVFCDSIALCRLGNLDRAGLVALEAEDALWWRNVWRTLFVLAAVLVLALRLNEKNIAAATPQQQEKIKAK